MVRNFSNSNQEQEMDKATMRDQTAEAVAAFLAAGGVIQTIKARSTPRVTMKAKSSKGTNFDAVAEREIRTSKIRTQGEINSHLRKRAPQNLLDIFA